MCHPGDANRSVCLKLALIYIGSEPPSRLLPHRDHTDEGEGNLQRMGISPDVQLRRVDWFDEGRLSVPSSIYPQISLNKKGWSSTIHVPARTPQIGEHANVFESLSGLKVPCGCLKSRRHWHAHARDGGHLEGMRHEIRVEEDLCSVSSHIKRRKKKETARPSQNQRSRSLRVRPSSSARLFSLSRLERVTSVSMCLYPCLANGMSRTKLHWDDGSGAAGCCDIQTPFSAWAVSLSFIFYRRMRLVSPFIVSTYCTAEAMKEDRGIHGWMDDGGQPST